MTNPDEQAVSRRNFLKAATVTAVAATATGAGAALYNQANSAAPTINSASNASQAVTTAVTAIDQSQPTELFTRLAAAQAENVRLQAALDATQGQLTSLQQNNQDAANSQALALELGQANEQIGVMAGLVALYEQLEAVDMETAVDQGLNAVSSSIETMLSEMPTLSESLQRGRQALQNLEAEMPLVENGRLWLIDHLGKIEAYFQSVEQLLAQTVDRVGPFLQMLNEWFENIKKWLPFGIGQAATTIMQSITLLIMETPNTLNGLDTNITQPLTIWLGRDQNNDTGLHQRLINPLRDELMPKTDSAISKMAQMDATYKTVLKEPVETAVASQRVIRNLIAEYRQQHGV